MNYALAEKTEKILGNEIWFDIYEIFENAIAIEIRGDWKHDHLRADYLMGQNGFTLLKEWVTEEDGSDWYKSVHVYGKEN